MPILIPRYYQRNLIAVELSVGDNGLTVQVFVFSGDKDSLDLKKMLCQSRIVFIGVDTSRGLPPLIPILKNLHQEVPSKELAFELVSLNVTVNELETLVSEYIDAGFNYIGLPSAPAILENFLNGKGLNGRPIDKRWPDTQFMVEYYGYIDVGYPNVYSFVDVNTLDEESLIQYNLTEFAQNAGSIYVIYQGKGDKVSQDLAEIAELALADLGLGAEFFEVGLSEEAISEVVNEISMNLPPPPAQSAIIHIVNWFDAEEYTHAALNTGLFDFPEDQVVHSSFLNEYYPVDTPLPVRLEIGKIPVRGVPSDEAAAIGLPLDPQEYYSLPYFLSYMDAYMWAATCGTTSGINDKQLRFDRDNVRIAYYLAHLHIPANTLVVETGPFSLNPRWFNEDARVVPEDVI